MRESDVCYSERFGDIYFSADDGLAETRHVFLDGNHLPAAWQGKTLFTIAETGFGTGLNFLAACALFERTAPADSRLHYIAWEKYPLPVSGIRDALSRWSGEFDGLLERLLDHYPPELAAERLGGHCAGELQDLAGEPGIAESLSGASLREAIPDGEPYGFSLRLSDRILLTLIPEDVNIAMPFMRARVDAWFLDGFAPGLNPEMWSETVFQEMARMSGSETTFATFTAAGFVRRGLIREGFAVNKVRGYGRKREMLVGVFGEKFIS